MGCFDVADGLSGITIKSGDDAMILLIVPSPESGGRVSTNFLRRKAKIEVGLQQVHNEGPCGLYTPFCLPIRGKYNDYGNLEKIVKDDTVKALEKYFEGSIEKILSAVGQGRYAKIHDDEITCMFGNKLKVNRYSSDGNKVTPNWLEKAGFKEKDGKFFHPDVPKIIKMVDGKVEKTNEPVVHVEFKVPDNKGEKEKCPHIMYWKDDKWNATWPSEQADFCESFMDHTKPMWFADTDHGVALGIKKEKVEKAMLLMKLSGMFLDGKLYDVMTKEIRTNGYAKENSNILDCYVTKEILDWTGFKFEKMMDTKKMVDVVDDGCRLNFTRNDWDAMYSHPLAPGYMFGASLVRPMCADMYRVKEGKLEKLETYIADGPNKCSYHPFSALGLAKMFEGVTGNKLDLSGLNDHTHFEIRLLRIQDLIKRRKNTLSRGKVALKEMKKFPKEDSSKEKMRLIHDYMEISDASEVREQDAREFQSLAFPLVFDMYGTNFTKPSERFLKDCAKFKNFMASLWGINRLIMPSAHFGQHGEKMDQLEFNRMVGEVLRSKILNGYPEQFSKMDDMKEKIELMYGGVEQPTKVKDELVFKHAGKKVAAWHEKEGYGYLITKEEL